MELLIIGYSNLFKNRILPILDELDFIDSISIAKYSKQDWDDVYKNINKPVKLYEDYQTALQQFNGNIAYISTTNHSHYEWAKLTLLRGINTIIDKPATIRLEETQELIEIAKEKNILLSESVVYLYHPQIKVLNNYLKENAFIPKHITFLFSFPPLDKTNFRYVKELGGGAILDTGSYLASICRFFFNEIPIESFFVKNAFVENDLEVSYSVLFKFSDGRSLVGHSGFTTEYVNRINVLGKDFCIDIDRVFTLPENVENTIRIRSENQSSELKTSNGNMFKEYFRFIYEAIKNNSYQELYANMLLDAQIRNLLK